MDKLDRLGELDDVHVEEFVVARLAVFRLFLIFTDQFVVIARIVVEAGFYRTVLAFQVLGINRLALVNFGGEDQIEGLAIDLLLVKSPFYGIVNLSGGARKITAQHGTQDKCK